MLSIICSIKWATNDCTYRPLTPLSKLPVELEYLAHPTYRAKLTDIKNCPCCQGPAISLLVNWVYKVPRIILLDSPVTCCLKTHRLLLAKFDEGSLRLRRHQIATSPFIPLEPRIVGIGDRIAEPLVSHSAYQALGISSQISAYFSEETNAIAYELPVTNKEDVLPDAIAFHSSDMPERVTLTLEPTTKCNFRCGFCYGRHIDQGNLSLKDFIAIIDQLPNLQAVEFTGEGEPLVNRHLFEMVRICVERGIWTHVTSNGSFINRETCERLLAAGPSSIAISLESIDPVQFARLRPGGKLETVLDAICTLVRLRRERGLSFKLRLWVTILRETLTQVDRIDEFARQTGVDLLEFQALNPMESYSRFYSDELRENMLSREEMEEIISDPSTSPALRSALASVISVYRGRKCDVFMSAVMAYWQGNVTPCRLLKTPHFPAYGNLAQDSFAEIWNREEYRFFRFALQHGIVLRSCKGCPSVASAVMGPTSVALA